MNLKASFLFLSEESDNFQKLKHAILLFIEKGNKIKKKKIKQTNLEY